MDFIQAMYGRFTGESLAVKAKQLELAVFSDIDRNDVIYDTIL